MNRLKKLKFTALVALLFLFIGASALTSCREQKEKEKTEVAGEHAEGEEHPEGAEHPTEEADEHPTEEGDEHPTEEGSEHPEGEHPTKKDSVGS